MTTGKTAITGLGAICAAGQSLSGIMRTLYAGQRNPAPPGNLQVDLRHTYPVFEVQGPLDGLYDSAPEGETTRASQLVLIAAEEALKQAGLDREALRQYRVGICLGTTVGCTLNDEPFYRDFRAGRFPELSPVQRYLDNNPAEFLRDLWGVSGPVAAVANACSSGTDAIGLARMWIETGQCDLAIAGGGDELSRIPYLGFIHLLISAEHPCRPFDRNRTGLNLGEGAGVVILESEATARERRASILASVVGYATFADAHHPTAPHPNGVGLKRAIRHALGEAGFAAGQVGFVNAHGTATPDNDRVEGRVLKQVFSDDVPIVATKAYTGHTLGAAGGLEAVFTVQALLDQRLPPTVGFTEPDPEINIRPTERETPIQAEAAMSNSLAFGGNNSVLVFQR